MSKNLFIASGIFHPESGGPATYLYEILPELQRRGWDIRALSYGDSPLKDYPYPLTRIPRRSLPMRVIQYARAARSLATWADLIYMHTLDLPVTGGNAPRIVKIVGDQAWERCIRKGWIPPNEDIDAFQTRSYTTQATLSQQSRRRQARALDGVIVPSHYLKRMVEGWGVPGERIHVIYNAMPTDDHTPEISPAEARLQLGLGDTPVLLTAARLLPWKGVDHLITALKAVPDVRLVVAGDGPMLDAHKAQAAATGIANRVDFLGKVPHERMALYMRAADYLALYSGYEGLSHTLLESLRAGTPVIASDKGGNPEVVQHGVNGLLVPYVDLGALAAALQAAFRPGMRQKLAANHTIGMERFHFDTMVDQTSAVLESFL